MNKTTSGCRNTAVGNNSLICNTTGCGNTAIGGTGTNNTTLGYNSGNDAVCCITTGSNNVVIGNNSVTDALVKVAWTVTSDARDKTCFSNVAHGLCFINQLTPIAFRFKKSREDETPSGQTRYGFKAQDILALEGDNPVIIDNNNPDNLKYKGEHLVPILVNAVKELTKKIESLESK
jgi:trimeric autotransporter adhesin